MAHRVKLANLVNMYRALRPWLLLGTENKEALKSDYNMFVSRNLTSSDVYLQKNWANKGAFMPAAYVLTNGSLAVNTKNIAIGSTMAGPVVSLITVPSGATLTSSTTFGTFCSWFTSGDGASLGWQDGMQVSVIAVSCANPDDQNYIAPIVTAFSFNLDSNSSETAANVLGAAFSKLSIESNTLKFQAKGETNSVSRGACVIASKTVGGKTLVNVAAMKINRGDTDHTVGASALQSAIESYGSTADPYLTTPTPEPLG